VSTDYRALCAELTPALNDWQWETDDDRYAALIARARAALAQSEPVAPTVIGPEWQPCVKLPITVHVREQRPGETHSSTREGITPLRPDDLIMRGVQGEEYPIGRELFNQTYRMGAALAQPEPVAPTDDDVTELFYRHMGEGSQVGFENAIAEALARWGTPAIQPVPVAPTDEDLLEAASNALGYVHIRVDSKELEANGEELIDFARAVLARWGTPAIQPVPVSERLPGPEAFDEDPTKNTRMVT